jgi:hypothetical protein
MTTCALPNADRPAVSAKGTVNPSESPIVASEIILASILNALFCAPFSNLPSCASKSKVLPSEIDPSASEECGWWLERPFSSPSNGCRDTVLQSTGLVYLTSRLDFRLDTVVCWKKTFFKPTRDKTLRKDMALGTCFTDDFLRRLGRGVFLKFLGVDAEADVAVEDSLTLVLEEADGFGTELAWDELVGSRFWKRSYLVRLLGGSFATIVVSYMFEKSGSNLSFLCGADISEKVYPIMEVGPSFCPREEELDLFVWIRRSAEL